ncbi:hypothetical protein [Cryobacterium sp. GrIS_2_6]|uniref:hypothetical protein n=1 Tax=Cryobacterium sp. GrIS_2_6 TaxID=3162785 RepID=UPI002E09C1E1|nr:hypothetical protein [Cryobacterium psychrotolerans]
MEMALVYLGIVLLLIALFFVWFVKVLMPWNDRQMAARRVRGKIRQDHNEAVAAERIAAEYRKKGRL